MHEKHQNPVRDKDVRRALRRWVKNEFLNDPDTLFIEELGLRHGSARVDFAAINGALHGYEIKSETDRLTRLPNQVKIYGTVMDSMTLVVCDKYLEPAQKIVPDWWGILVAKRKSKTVSIQNVRYRSENSNVEPMAVAELLWRSEVIDELDKLGIPERELRGSKPVLYAKLIERLQINELKRIARKCLKRRKNWRGH